MRKKKIYTPPVEVVALISTIGPMWETEKREQTQENFIREYARDNNICIVGVVRKKGLGQEFCNQQFDEITRLIYQERVDGVIVANMRAISIDIVDAHNKIGKVKQAGGVIVTAADGYLEMDIKWEDDIELESDGELYEE